jgi:hypothetical protein
LELMNYTLCVACGGAVPAKRTALGMVTCSGTCNARRRRETGLVDLGEAYDYVVTLDGAIHEGRSTLRDFVPVVTLPAEVEEGRAPEWRRGFTAGVLVGLVVGLVLPLLVLVDVDAARADAPIPVDTSTAVESHPACLAVVDDLVEALTNAHVEGGATIAAWQAQGRDLVEAEARADRLAAKVERKAATIERLRAKIRGTR